MIADLLAGCAVLDGEGLTTAFGHLSLRTPAGTVLVSGNQGPGLVSSRDDIVEVDLDGNLVGGEESLRAGEVPIHLGILATRRDVGSVCRFHGPACMAFSTLGRSLPATIGMGLFLGAEVPWFDTSQTVTTLEQGAQLPTASATLAASCCAGSARRPSGGPWPRRWYAPGCSSAARPQCWRRARSPSHSPTRGRPPSPSNPLTAQPPARFRARGTTSATDIPGGSHEHIDLA